MLLSLQLKLQAVVHVLAKFETTNITFVRGVRSYARCGYRVTFPNTRCVSVSAYVRSQGRVPEKPMKFGEDGTMYAKVMSDFVFCGE